MAGEWESFDWRGRPARAWVPAPLHERDLTISPTVLRRAQQAEGDLRLADARLPAYWHPLVRMILRTEGIASSRIEGVVAPLDEVLVAEIDRSDGEVAWIVDNLHAVGLALESPELFADELHRWHAVLMGRSGLAARHIGAFRDVPGWIGGSSPLDAVFVPPLPHRIAALIDDLVAFCHDASLDAVTQAAIAHAQFETIHPYADGNGRIGRILIGWVLRHRGVVLRLPPPLSVFIARDPGGYLAGLHDFRQDSLDSWVDWFAGVAQTAATQTEAFVVAVDRVIADWQRRLAGLREDAAARRVLPLLPQAPVLTSERFAELVGVSERAARNALQQLAEAGVVAPLDLAAHRPGRPRLWWVATDLVAATRTWVG